MKSEWNPRRLKEAFGRQHLGQGHNPLSRIVAIITLSDEVEVVTAEEGEPNILFWIISWICENPGVDTAQHPITTLDYNTVPVGPNKFVVQYILPDRMEKLALAMSQQIRVITLVRKSIQESIDGFRKLDKTTHYCQRNINYTKLTDGINATGWHIPRLGDARLYLDRLPKKRYTGHAVAWPNWVRCVLSDQNMRPAITRSRVQPSSLRCFCKSSWAWFQASDVYNSS